ncbi:MAG: 4-hydroxy-tetrahydrodipicolinate synthase [Rickettsiales bacterium]|nr:4-hydroxy-tetrahydrodipicolinate synthase [Rickettsiales bacterium]
MFQGVYTALITPFEASNLEKVDYSTFEKLLERQISEGIHGVVPCGTTGESPTLTNEEHDKIIEASVQIVKKRIPVLAGTGSNSTREAIERTLHAEKVGADGALIMTPYYNKPTQEGIFQHFKAIHDATNIPIIIYNIPGRSVVDIKDETIARIAELPRIAGLKDATGDLSRPTNLKKIFENNSKLNSKIFYQMSGDDETAVDFNKLGGVGCISVSSNLLPKICAEVQDLCKAKKFEEAKNLDNKISAIHKDLFIESSPQPIKFAMEYFGLCSGNLRLPLVKISEQTEAKLKSTLNKIATINSF